MVLNLDRYPTSTTAKSKETPITELFSLKVTHSISSIKIKGMFLIYAP